MIDVISYYLVRNISEKLEFADVWAGLVKPMRKKVNNADKVFPVAINLPTECNMSDYMALVPDSGKRSIIYAELTDQPEVVSSNRRYSQVNASIKLVCWYNLDKITKGDYISVDYLVKRVQSLIPKTIPDMPASGISSIHFAITGVEYGTSIVSKYTYNEIKSQFGTHPYGLFAIDLDVWYISTLAADCSNPFDIEAGCISGSGNHGTAATPPEPPEPPEPCPECPECPEIPDGWVRPADWLPIPDIPEGDQRFYGLYAVYDDDANFVAMSFEGDYIVDWGDGHIEAFSSGDVAEHRFNYADLAGSECSRGYRQALITVVPAGLADLTRINTNKIHSDALHYSYTRAWLDILIRASELERCGVGEAAGTHYLLERVRVVGDNKISDLSESLSDCPRLEVVEIDTLEHCEYFSQFCSYSYSLEHLKLNNSSSAVDFLQLAANSFSLKKIEIAGITSLVTNFVQMCEDCINLVTPPQIDTSGGIYFNNFLYGCYQFRELPDYDFGNAISLPVFNQISPSLTRIRCKNIRINCDFSDLLLSRSALIEIFTNLATVSGKTINVSGNFGVADLTPADIQIATDKGWTVITS